MREQQYTKDLAGGGPLGDPAGAADGSAKSINLNELAPTIEAAVHAAIDGPGLVPTPKSADLGRQMENLDIFGFTLSDEEMVALGSLDRPDLQMLDADSFGH